MSTDSKDLPLMSNTDDILVEHYVIFLTCHFDKKFFDGKLYVYVKPTTPSCCENKYDEFVVILDSKDIVVDKVDEIFYRCDSNDNTSAISIPFCESLCWSMEDALELEKMPTKSIHFQVEDWCLKIWKSDVHSPLDFPRLLCIRYKTTTRGTSVTWVKDQDHRDCCFTPGVWINNRALLPCQEPPTAMATWQAFITVPQDAMVIMSGDKFLRITDIEDTAEETTMIYFESRMRLPIATMALAIGFWKDVLVTNDDVFTPKQVENTDHDYCRIKYKGIPFDNIVCRMIAPVSVLPRAYQELGVYLPKYLKAATELLGLYPFPRLDLVVLPRCFDCLGMASPNVIFISQSLLPGDGSMRIHLAHELSHAWFGLLIGAADWTEEWLSEGFATYMEDLIYVQATNWNCEKDIKDWMELRAYLRYRTMVSELEISPSELQTLSVNKVSDVTAAATTVSYVKHGMNSEKKFLQVHYLKGYFLLKYLSEVAGDNFTELLKDYIRHYHGQLVHSQEIFKLFFDTFPHARNTISIDILKEEWLTNSGIPKNLEDYKLPIGNPLYDVVCTQVTWWRRFNRMQSRSRKRFKLDYTALSKLTTEQLVLLLEMLLGETKLFKRTMRALDSFYEMENQNATVRHRWCELVIKYDYSPGISAVEKFLLEDQGMGVYLYGELMVSEKFHLQNVARDCWQKVQHELSPSTFQIVKVMIDG